METDLRTKRAAPLKRTSRGRAAGQDPENQTEKISAYIRRQGMREVEGYVKAASAFSGDRWPDTFKQILADHKAGKFDVLVFLRAERFSRQAQRGMRLMFELADAGVTVRSVEDREFEELDQRGTFPMTRLSMKLEIAEQDSYVKSERTKDGHKRGDDGLSPRGRPPAGYRITGEKFEKKIVPGELASAVTRLITSVSDGVSLTRAARDNGFSRPTASKIVANDAYSAGYWRVQAHDGRVLDFPCPPLVPRDVHLRAQDLTKARKGERAARNQSAEERGDYGGAVWCWCGLRRYHATTKKRGKVYHYAKCGAGHSVNAGYLTAEVNRKLSAVTEVRITKEYRGAGPRAGELADVQRAIEEWSAATGDVDELVNLRAARDELLASGEAEGEYVRQVRGAVSYGEFWQSLDHAGRLAVLRSGEVAVVVERDGNVRVTYPAAGFTGDDPALSLE
jgi:DNA invertase Pin-like site-specific DNA recombinase